MSGAGAGGAPPGDAAAMRLVLASNNPGKLAELRAILEGPLLRPRLHLVAQGELGIGPAPEPHDTFLENALAKARHAALASGAAAIADDSGLCCTALAGGPGVRSARLAGEHASDGDNNAALLRALAGASDRSAHYTCVIVALRSADDPEPLVAHARWHGAILDAPAGEGGFGYDPYFHLPGLGRTAAQLDAAHKNRVSHRALAVRDIAARIRACWG
jgi:XTP/dITP diphosphohydrolase